MQVIRLAQSKMCALRIQLVVVHVTQAGALQVGMRIRREERERSGGRMLRDVVRGVFSSETHLL